MLIVWYYSGSVPLMPFRTVPSHSVCMTVLCCASKVTASMQSRLSAEAAVFEPKQQAGESQTEVTFELNLVILYVIMLLFLTVPSA